MGSLRFCLAAALFLFLISHSFAGSGAAMSLDRERSLYAHYLTGILLDNANQAQDALKEFEQASQIDPDSDVISLRIAVDYLKLNENKKALAQLNKTLELNPDNSQARTLLAFLYTAEGEFALAEIQYEIILKQALKEEPENLDVHNFLGQFYFQQRKFDKALEQFKLILGKDPKNKTAKLFLGLVYDEKNLRPQAIKEFKEILAIEPDNADALNALGYLYAESGENLDEAQNLILKALKQEPKNGAYVDSLGWVYFKKGDFKKAREKLEEAIFLIEDPVIFDHLGDTYFKLGDKNKAQEVWQKALKIKSNDEKTTKEIQAKIEKLK